MLVASACSKSPTAPPARDVLVSGTILTSDVDPGHTVAVMTLLITPSFGETGTITMSAKASDGQFAAGNSPGGTGLSADWTITATGGSHYVYACATTGNHCTPTLSVITVIF